MRPPHLVGCVVTGGDLVLVGGESRQHFRFFGLGDFEKVQGPSEFRCDLIEFCGRNLKIPVGLLKAQRRCAGLSGRELERSTRNFADPERPHELEASQPP